jgi:protein-disulfide isomerase
MPQNLLLRTLMATALAAACTRSGTPAAKGSQSTATATTATTASADGNVAAVPHDSISDRADRGRILGDSTAPIWVIMASDFQCPYCKQWHDASFQRIMKSYVETKRVRVAFVNVPLSMHQNAVPASEAAMCASVQNKFWPLHEALFASQARWETLPNPVPTLDSIASANGVEMPAWRDCMSQHATRPLIQADHDRITSKGINSTPSFFVGTQQLSGADANVIGAIEAELAKAGKKPAA